MKVLFVYQAMASFVDKDLRILESRHDVRALRFRGPQDMAAVASATEWTDITFSWFGKLHALFAVLFSRVLGKPSVVVAGGDDVANEPEINYGMLNFWWKRWCPLFVFRHADLILSVSEFNKRETIRNARADPAKVKMVYHGFDAHRWQPNGDLPKDKLVVTVGRVTVETLVAKGLMLFVEAARHLPHLPFALVGPWEGDAITDLRAVAPPNVTFSGGVYGNDLLAIYAQAPVYVQSSVRESFGCAVAESMLCECVPVVSRRAALPEVVGDCGVYVGELTAKGLSEGIREALTLGPEWGKRARQRIVDRFPLERRRDALLAALDEVTA